MTTTASIAAAIAAAHPHEELWADQLASELAAAAEARGVPLTAALAYVSDRPKLTLSAPGFLRWCDRFNIGPIEGANTP